MNIYNTDIHNELEVIIKIDINTYDLEKFITILPCVRELNQMLGVTQEEYLTACRILEFKNEMLLNVMYFNPDFYHGILLQENAALCKAYDLYNNMYFVNYSAYAVPAQQTINLECKLIRYFLEKRFPKVLKHPDFGWEEKDIEISLSSMRLSQIIAEYGNTTLHTALFDLHTRIKEKRYIYYTSKFEIYPINCNIDQLYRYEIALLTSAGKLYIPIQALVEKKFNLIKSWQIGRYPNGLYDEILHRQIKKILRSPESKMLEELLKSFKENKQ